MLKQTFTYKENGKHDGFIAHQVSNPQMKSSNLMVPITPKYWQGPLEVPYMSSMFLNNGVEIGCKGKSTFESDESSSTNITGGMGGFNLTPHLVNPLMNLLLVSKA
jgi:hypothetical protein